MFPNMRCFLPLLISSQKKRGAPLFWAIYDNLSNLGISIYYMQKGIDDGDIIDQTKIKIKREDNVTQLMKNLFKVSKILCKYT